MWRLVSKRLYMLYVEEAYTYIIAIGHHLTLSYGRFWRRIISLKIVWHLYLDFVSFWRSVLILYKSTTWGMHVLISVDLMNNATSYPRNQFIFIFWNISCQFFSDHMEVNVETMIYLIQYMSYAIVYLYKFALCLHLHTVIRI